MIPPSTVTPSAWPRPGTSLYYALATAPPERRPGLTRWLQWWHEVSQIPMAVSDPTVAQAKLGWWAQEVQHASQGKPQHPLLQGWQQPSGGVQPPDWSLCLEQLEGLTSLVQQTRWLDEASLHRQADITTGAACEGAALLLGADSPAARQAARQLGQGLCLANQLARLGQDARSGRVHVAIDVLQAHGVRAHELTKPSAQVPQGWSKLLAHLSQQAKQALQEGLSAINALSPSQAKALLSLRVLAHIHLAQTQAIEAAGNLVLHERIVLTPVHKWWIAQQVRWGLLR